jgi:hypothetical protein
MEALPTSAHGRRPFGRASSASLGATEGRRAPRRECRSNYNCGRKRWLLRNSFVSDFIQRSALLACVRCRQSHDILAMGKPKMKASAAKEDPEELAAAGATPLHILIVSPPHDAVPPCALRDVQRARCAASRRTPLCAQALRRVRSASRCWHRVLRHSRTTTPGYITTDNITMAGTTRLWRPPGAPRELKGRDRFRDNPSRDERAGPGALARSGSVIANHGSAGSPCVRSRRSS